MFLSYVPGIPCQLFRSGAPPARHHGDRAKRRNLDYIAGRLASLRDVIVAVVVSDLRSMDSPNRYKKFKKRNFFLFRHKEIIAARHFSHLISRMVRNRSHVNYAIISPHSSHTRPFFEFGIPIGKKKWGPDVTRREKYVLIERERERKKIV